MPDGWSSYYDLQAHIEGSPERQQRAVFAEKIVTRNAVEPGHLRKPSAGYYAAVLEMVKDESIWETTDE